MRYIEGEGGDRRADARVMNELAAFCHLCDVASGRLFYDFPREESEPWPGAGRFR